MRPRVAPASAWFAAPRVAAFAAPFVVVTEGSPPAGHDLDELAPGWAHRLDTDGRTVFELAHEAVALTGWLTDA